MCRDRVRHARYRPYKTLQGFSLCGDPGLDRSRDASGEVGTVRARLTQVDAFVDVGANVGLFTCLAAQAGVPTLAIEPERSNVALLLRNLTTNGFSDRVEVFPIALGATPGVRALHGGGQGASLLGGWGGIRSTYAVPTPLNTLDNLLADRFRGARLLVKLDVEGAEYEVVCGARRLLAAEPAPIWIVEHGLKENWGGALNPNFEKLFALFWSHGYRANAISPAPRAVEIEDVQRWLARGRRDFGGIDYLFERAPS